VPTGWPSGRTSSSCRPASNEERVNRRLSTVWGGARRPRTWRVVIGWSELLGAALGLTVLALGVMAAGARNLGSRPLPALAFYALSGVAGWRLLRGQRGGVELSLAVQAAQAAWLWLPGLVFRMAAGLALIPLYTNRGGLDAIVGGTAAFELAVAPADDRVGLGLNLFALAAVVALTALVRSERAAASAGPRPASDEPVTPAL
jgi:hypothetical protein